MPTIAWMLLAWVMILLAVDSTRWSVLRLIADTIVANIPLSFSSKSCIVQLRCLLVIDGLVTVMLLIAYIFLVIASCVGAWARHKAMLFGFCSINVFLFCVVWSQFSSQGCERTNLPIQCRSRRLNIKCGTIHIAFPTCGRMSGWSSLQLCCPQRKNCLIVFTMVKWDSLLGKFTINIILMRNSEVLSASQSQRTFTTTSFSYLYLSYFSRMVSHASSIASIRKTIFFQGPTWSMSRTSCIVAFSH